MCVVPVILGIAFRGSVPLASGAILAVGAAVVVVAVRGRLAYGRRKCSLRVTASFSYATSVTVLTAEFGSSSRLTPAVAAAGADPGRDAGTEPERTGRLVTDSCSAGRVYLEWGGQHGGVRWR